MKNPKIKIKARGNGDVEQLVIRGTTPEIMAMSMVVLEELSEGSGIPLTNILEFMLELADEKERDEKEEDDAFDIMFSRFGTGGNSLK